MLGPFAMHRFSSNYIDLFMQLPGTLSYINGDTHLNIHTANTSLAVEGCRVLNAMNSDRLLGFLDELYETSLGRGSWRDAIEAFADVAGAVTGNLLFWDKKSGLLPRHETWGISDEAMELYATHWVLEDPRSLFLANNPDLDIYHDDQYASPKQRKRLGYFNDWEHKYTPFKYLIGMRLHKSEDMEALFATGHAKYQEDLVARVTKLYRQVSPHMVRAVEIHKMFGSRLVNSRVEQVVLESLGFGVVFLDQFGRECYHNRKAAEIFSRGDGVSLTLSGIKLECRSSRSTFEGLVRDCRDREILESRPRGGWLSAPCAEGTDSYLMLVAPVPELDDLHLFSSPRVIVFISDQGGQRCSLGKALSQLFGLTCGESKVCQELIAGKSTTEIAEQLKVSREAIRFHLKNIFGKTGVKRQSELIRLILTMPGALVVHED
jgi:DNA-binding CsgD family transcriptional regulator